MANNQMFQKPGMADDRFTEKEYKDKATAYSSDPFVNAPLPGGNGAEEEPTPVKTAGFMGLPNIVWIGIGAVILYSVAKQQKWIK